MKIQYSSLEELRARLPVLKHFHQFPKYVTGPNNNSRVKSIRHPRARESANQFFFAIVLYPQSSNEDIQESIPC